MGPQKVLFKRKAEVKHWESPRFLHTTSQKKLFSIPHRFTEFGWRHTAHRILLCPLWTILLWASNAEETAWQCSELLSLLSSWTCHIYQCREFKEASLWFKSLPSNWCILSQSLGSLYYPSSLSIYFPCGSAVSQPREIWVSTKIIHERTVKVLMD